MRCIIAFNILASLVVCFSFQALVLADDAKLPQRENSGRSFDATSASPLNDQLAGHLIRGSTVGVQQVNPPNANAIQVQSGALRRAQKQQNSGRLRNLESGTRSQNYAGAPRNQPPALKRRARGLARWAYAVQRNAT
eukprot:CAMPEP_0202917750 /NCGR_PEP_ID=MMETSP1392-20130828/71753_1 /ASSEMBLY_ACC=CAM_ASM_000868 /TAXON_ID=225041 /ORGANISM="Chlamydomonas chlamydogama, Strain SAG 11-48b" /LENGTH=136 /DNA_ID=CAMNT_0049610607 /DNA_START=258 /DNA_END=664 /DNA_ORIENTATION=+